MNIYEEGTHMDIYVVGAGGFGSEVEWLIHRANKSRKVDEKFRVIFVNQLLNPGNREQREHCNLPVLSGSELASIMATQEIFVAIALGDSGHRQRIFQELGSEYKLQLPVLIDPSVQYDERPGKILFGDGTIVCAGSILTTNIKIGRLVHINLDCTVGHDAEIGDFCTLSPGVHISGHVKIDSSVLLGTGAVVLPRVHIGHHSTIGAGAVVTKDVPPHTMVVGIPAKPK